jgi:hypothetical protein
MNSERASRTESWLGVGAAETSALEAKTARTAKVAVNFILVEEVVVGVVFEM